MSADSENLSDLFGPSAAASVSTAANTLAGRLPDRRTSAVDAVAANATPAARVTQQPQRSEKTTPVARPQTEHRHDDGDADDDLPAQISVYVLPAVVTTVRRTRNGRTNAQIAFQAITALRDQLPELVAAHRRTAAKPSAAVGPFAPQPGDRSSSTRRVLWTFKATGRNQRVLDKIVGEAGAGSRSELVAAALEAHLLRRRQRS
ncbi:hypothetical protein O7630_35560 [Micromonospora sp. WMMD718]|uniref:hypothetical protein n=2 Tax=unclassified Micromonospora TaxID=2617518 RepID=UPI0024174F65|nr:hypothetical protein [Micromonospora sp. WMMD718]MDG4756268.1 hypothetical protein [Micromonospora sp. WMMD718]